MVALAVLVAACRFRASCVYLNPLLYLSFSLTNIQHPPDAFFFCFDKQYHGYRACEYNVQRQCTALSCACSRLPLLAHMDLLPNELTPFILPLSVPLSLPTGISSLFIAFLSCDHVCILNVIPFEFRIRHRLTPAH